MAKFGDMVMLLIAVSLVLLAVLVWNTVFKDLIKYFMGATEVNPGVYALALLLLAGLVLWWYSKSKTVSDQPVVQNSTFILVAAVVFLAAVSVSNVLESWLKGVFNVQENSLTSEFVYAAGITIVVSLILYLMSRKSDEKSAGPMPMSTRVAERPVREMASPRAGVMEALNGSRTKVGGMSRSF